MFWLTWRQFRVQALVAATALTALALYLAVLGRSIRHTYSSSLVGCPSGAEGSGGVCEVAKQQFEHLYNTPIILLTLLMVAVPGVLGLTALLTDLSRPI
jgi:hypothetical protein